MSPRLDETKRPSILIVCFHVGLDSYDQKMHRNDDGSVDIYFGVKPPAGQEANWIPTVSGRGYFPWFRFYGPERPLFEKSWKLPDIEKVTQ